MHLRSTYEPRPSWKFSDTVFQRQQCDQNTWQNNLRFLHRTATYKLCMSGVYYTSVYAMQREVVSSSIMNLYWLHVAGETIPNYIWAHTWEFWQSSINISTNKSNLHAKHNIQQHTLLCSASLTIHCFAAHPCNHVHVLNYTCWTNILDHNPQQQLGLSRSVLLVSTAPGHFAWSHQWHQICTAERVSGGRQARKMATTTKLSMVTLIGVYTHNLLSSTLYVLQTQFWTDSQTNCGCLYFCTYHLITTKILCITCALHKLADPTPVNHLWFIIT